MFQAFVAHLPGPPLTPFLRSLNLISNCTGAGLYLLHSTTIAASVCLHALMHNTQILFIGNPQTQLNFCHFILVLEIIHQQGSFARSS